MILFIDTTDFNKVIYMVVGERVIKKIYTIDSRCSHEILQKLRHFLESAGVRLHSAAPASKTRGAGLIRKIYVNKGPGSFTGTRVGAAHALALQVGWGIKVQFLPKEKFEQAIKKAAA